MLASYVACHGRTGASSGTGQNTRSVLGKEVYILMTSIMVADIFVLDPCFRCNLFILLPSCLLIFTKLQTSCYVLCCWLFSVLTGDI